MNMKQSIRKVVVARLVGGIGNQLFIYSTARSIAFFNNAELVLDIYSGFAYDTVYKQQYQLDKFNIKNIILADKNSRYVLSRLGRFIIRLINTFLPFRNRFYISQKGRDFDYRIPQLKFKSRIYIEGYWQSELYFKEIEKYIREDLKIIAPQDIKNKNLSLIIQNCNSVAIHLRYFDIKEKMIASAIPDIKNANGIFEEYYTKAIERINNLVHSPHYFIFSDKPELSRKVVSKFNIQFTVVDHNIGYENAYADLWLMSLCKHFIIANSIFSWWGAWLATNEKKIIISPGTFNNKSLEAWSFEGLLPESWDVLNL